MSTFGYSVAAAVCLLVGLTTALPTVSLKQQRQMGQFRNLNNTVELDPEGTFRLDWTIIYDVAGNPDIQMEMRVLTKGWMSVRFQQTLANNRTQADFFYGAFDPNNISLLAAEDRHCTLSLDTDACTNPNGPAVDIINNYKLIGVGTDADHTYIRFERRADTGDAQEDIVIKPGPIMIGWAYGTAIVDESGKPAPIAKRGSKLVSILPGLDVHHHQY